MISFLQILFLSSRLTVVLKEMTKDKKQCKLHIEN